MGGSKSKAATQTTNPSTVYAAQDPYLQDMYSQAQKLYQQQSSPDYVDPARQSLDQYGQQLGYASNALGQAGNTFQSALGQMNQAGQGYQQGYDALGQAGNSLQQSFANVGRGYGALDQAQTGYQSFMNPGVNPMSDVYARQAGQQFREQIMPELQGQQMLTGGFGGSRGQIGEALAGARAAQQLQDWNAQLYDADMNRKLAASQGLAGLGGQYGQLGMQQGTIGNYMNQNALGYGSLAQGQGNLGTAMGNLGAQQTGLGNAFAGLGGQYGQYSNAQSAYPWQNLQRYQGLLGSPTVLGGGGSSTGGTAGSSGGWGTAIGIAGLVAAPFTGGASLAVASAANSAVNSYYK